MGRSKRATAKQSASEILESMSDAFVAIDRQWRYTYVNSAAERIVGLRREQMLGRSVWELFPQEETRFKRACYRAMDEGEITHIEEYYAPLETWFEDTVYPTANGITVYARDITERKRAEQRLAFHANLLENVHDAIVATDEQLVVTAWNRAAEDIYGWKADEVIGRDVRAVVRSELDAARRDEVLRRVAEAGHGQVETIHHRKDGTPIHIEGSVMALRNAAGQVTGYVAAHRDITERKRAEEALREKEQFIHHITELSPVVLDVFDLETESHSYFSSDVSIQYGYTPDEMAQMKELFSVMVHPEDIPRLRENIERLKRLEDGEIQEFECRLQRRDGEWRWMMSRSMVFARNGKGEVRQVVSATLDVTERRRADEALRASEERLRLLVDSAKDYAIFTLDSEGRVSSWNPGAERAFGYSEAEIIGRSGETLFTPEDRQRGEPAEEMRRAREEGRASDERYHLRQDGTRFFASGVMTFLRDHGTEGYAKIARDLTERKEAEEALRHLHEELEQRVIERTSQVLAVIEELRRVIIERERAEETLREAQAELVHVTRVIMMGELTASIAHEVNQPLGAIVTNAHACLRLLAREIPDLDKSREVIARIIDDGIRAGDVIKRIRSLLKRAAPEKELLNINETIRGAISPVAGELVKNQVVIRTELEPALSPVLGDRILLQQVVMNLILNGNEAMSDEGWQTRELLISSHQSRHDEVTVAVRDTGQGLDPQDADRFFDAFFTTKESGLGLGLSISRTIIEAHGGRLWAIPNAGKGATFQFTLPASFK